jgi:hypothetical protein
VLLLVFTPAQIDRISKLRYALSRQEQIQNDLQALIKQPPGLITTSCNPITVPNHRPVPALSLWLNLPPEVIFSADDQLVSAGQFIAAATPQVDSDYILDPRDRDRSVIRPPRALKLAGGNSSWLVYKRCTKPSG